jgi:DNA-binding beta-propeller fold protein YncE
MPRENEDTPMNASSLPRFAVCLLLTANPALAQSLAQSGTTQRPAQSCNAPASDVTSFVALPGAPFFAVPTADGCTIFVSIAAKAPQSPGRIIVLRRISGQVDIAQDIVLPEGSPAGMALSHDGKVLAVSNGVGIVLLGTAQLLTGDATPIAQVKDAGVNGRPSGSVFVAITADDKLLFVSDEAASGITIYDLAKMRGGSAAAIGTIPVSPAPIGLAFSPDGSRLYATSGLSQPGTNAATCPAEAGGGGNTPQGVLTVVDVARAEHDPAGSVLAKVPAGCAPVRVELSSDGSRAFVTARGQDSLLVFDTAKLVRDSAHALVASGLAGLSPVGVALAGDKVFTANSNRFTLAGRKSEWLSAIDSGSAKVIGNIPAGLFPRELRVTDDGRTLLVTNFGSNTLELIDLTRLTSRYYAQQSPAKTADDQAMAKVQAAAAERTRNHQATPGTEAALRHMIDGLIKGAPDFDAMAPGFADFMRQQSAGPAAAVQKFGALQDVTFKAANANGFDTFSVTFERARTDWNILLSPDGKVIGFNFHPAS